MTTQTETTVRQERARTIKALRLTAALRAAGATHDDYTHGRINWALAEAVAGTHAASHATRQMVAAMLAVSEGEAPADPFAGLA